MKKLDHAIYSHVVQDIIDLSGFEEHHVPRTPALDAALQVQQQRDGS